jgi:hypothetical protein
MPSLRLMDLGLMSARTAIFGIPGDQPQHTWLHWADNDYSVLREAGFDGDAGRRAEDWITHADALEVNCRPKAARC